MKRSLVNRINLILLILVILPALMTVSVSAKQRFQKISEKDRQYLIQLFKNDGYQPQTLHSTFQDKRLVKLPIVIHKNVNNKENRRNYQDFHSPYSLKMAHRFSKRWRSVLQKASQQFEVDKEVLVAILLVETGLGNVLGRYPVVSVFSSILLEYRDKQAEFKTRATLTENQKYVLERLTLKSSWARTELAALLSIAESTDYNPFQLKGSFAGAFGIPQFLPSSYLKWGYDSDRNGSVNLFLFPDAIFSTANYLRAHGWKKGLYLESNKDVIYKYNRSQVYVETVLEVAKKIQTYQNWTKRKVTTQTKLGKVRHLQHPNSSS